MYKMHFMDKKKYKKKYKTGYVSANIYIIHSIYSMYSIYATINKKNRCKKPRRDETKM